MDNNINITVNLTEDEWHHLDGTAHFNSLSAEQFLLHLVQEHIIQPEQQSEVIFKIDKSKTEFESLMQNIDFYLTQAIKEAERYDDSKMMSVLSRLRDHHIHHHNVCTDLYKVYVDDRADR